MDCDGKILLQRCVPVVAHGDEGRGRRHGPYLVLNWHSLIGRGCNASGAHCLDYNKLLLNFKGHDLTTRMLAGALPKGWYTDEHDDVFQALLEFMACEAVFMATSGVEDLQGETTWALMLGMTEDWPWLVKSGGLTRRFSRVQKQLWQKHPPAGRGHLCRAGHVDVSSHNASAALQAQRQGRALLAVMPKGHAFHPLVLQCDKSSHAPGRRWLLNLLARSTQMGKNAL